MKKAFTLIELLIVIAIVAVLAGILFPVLARAKEAAYKAGCMSNFSQFGLAFSLYSNDNDDTLINPGDYDRDSSDTGQQALDPYVQVAKGGNKASIYVCPSDSQVIPQTTLLGGPSDITWKGYPTTYGMNVFLQPGNPKDPDPDQCFTPPSQQLSVSWNGPPYSNESNLFYNGQNQNTGGLQQSTVVDPSDTDLLFESVVEGGTSTSYTGVSQRGGDYMNVQGFFKSQQQANNWYVSTMAYTLQPATDPWHPGGNNYLFIDGHVICRHPEQVGYDLSAHPMDNIWLVKDGRDGSSAPTPGHC